MVKISAESQEWWLKSIIPACGKLRQEDRCEFEASVDYTVNHRQTSLGCGYRYRFCLQKPNNTKKPNKQNKTQIRQPDFLISE